LKISSRLFQLFKYSVYALLAFNIYVFWGEEELAAAVQFPNGIPAVELINAYAATIDTAAWVVLLLMFELETYVLEDQHYNRTVTWSLHFVRALCYTVIVYAFYGYVVNLMFHYKTVSVDGVSDLCALVSNGWSYAIDLDDYVGITANNCTTLSDAGAYFRFEAMPTVVDADGLRDIRLLAWVDAINAAVWLLIVIVLEVDVWLREHDRLQGRALRISNTCKFVLYGMLLLAAIYWGFKGDFVDFWDAFLWLVAFIFIELNVFEWRHEASNSAV
jgi:hypothetical protein